MKYATLAMFTQPFDPHLYVKDKKWALLKVYFIVLFIPF